MRTLTGALYASDPAGELNLPVSFLLSDGHSALKIGNEWLHLPIQVASCISQLIQAHAQPSHPTLSAPSSLDPVSNQSDEATP